MGARAVLILSISGVGCGEGSEAGEPDQTAFIAFAPDFAGFERWRRFDVQGVAGLAHPAGARSVFINRLPAKSATAFPVGTVIVKRTEGGDTFAMVKRGGEYNRSGAVDWEWFELEPVGGAWAIAWRGIAPPSGSGYGDIEGGTCNDCHAGAKANDFVYTAALRFFAP